MYSRTLIALVAMALVACSTDVQKPGPLPVAERITARELPPPVKGMYVRERHSESVYQAGPLSRQILVYETDQGPVFVDTRGGQKAFAESCAALTSYVASNDWQDHAAGCLREDSEA
jgi:hypothetical protein